MYNKLPVKDRMEWLKSYKSTYPNNSYHQAVDHYNNGLQEFGDGGKLPTNGMLQQGDPTKLDENTDPMWFQYSTFPYRIKDDNKRNETIKNFYWNLRDEGRTPEQSIKGIKEMNGSYGTDRFDGTRKDYFENYHGFDHNDINNDSLNKWEGEYKLPIKKFGDGGTLPKSDATHYYTNDINDYAKRTRAYADSLNINLINNRQLDNSSLVNTNFSSRNPLYNEYKPTQQIMPLQPKPQVKVEPKPVAYQPIVNKPITKQEPKPIPSVSEIVKQPIIPVKPKEEVKSTGGYGTTQDKTGRTYYYFDDKSGRRNWLTEDDYTRKIMH